MNNLTIDPYNQLSPLDPTTLNILGCFLTLLFIFGVFFNGLLLNIFYRHKELRVSLNMFVIAITIFNFLGCLFELPWVIHSNFAHRWSSAKLGCHLSGFLMFFIGCTSVHLMAAISFERFYIMYKPLNIRKINFNVCYVAIFICVLCGLFWSGMPLLGWSHYALEGGLVSCGVELKEKTNNVRSFIIAIFIFVYLIPFGLIIVTNLKLLLIIKRMPNMNKGNTDEKTQKRLAVQRSITYIMIIYIAGFVLSWTPYAVVSFYGAFIASEDVEPIAGTIPAYFAKSSMVWSTLFYIFTNRKLKSKLTREGITGTASGTANLESSVGGNQSGTNTNTNKTAGKESELPM